MSPDRLETWRRSTLGPDTTAREAGGTVILYSSIGHGHLMAARSIQAEILRTDPQARVILKDIREFMPAVQRKLDENIYLFVANHLPECFESLFWSRQEEGNQAASLASLPNDYPEDPVAAYLRAQAPKTVLATHYGAAQLLGTLRERGLLPGVKVGWVHTDFFEGYFPRISKRIDRTFLAHPELAARWEAAGVPGDLITVSGMPVAVPPTPAGVRQETFQKAGLDPALPTVLIAGGKGGSGDYAGMVRSLAAHSAGPLQIVALCGTNTRQQEALARVAADLLTKGIRLLSLGLVPQPEVMAWMQSIDVMITKAGGLTPAEAFTVGIPTILLVSVLGHERENAELFRRCGLATLALDPEQAGVEALGLLGDSAERKTMASAQAAFRGVSDISLIARFALDPAITPKEPPSTFGETDGQGAKDVAAALAQLEAVAPAQLEVLLSHSTTTTPRRIATDNPFGHIALSVAGTVFSTNHLAESGKDRNFLQHMSLGDYLYGVSADGSQEIASTFGMAYGRDTIGLRVTGLPPSSLAAMKAEAQRIEAAFLAGTLRWNLVHFNCADLVARILAAGGFVLQPWGGVRRLGTMPLDVFERSLTLFRQEDAVGTELIAYRKLAGAQGRYTLFPLSFTQPFRSIGHVLDGASADLLDRAVTRQVTGYGEGRLLVEDVRARPNASSTTIGSSAARTRRELKRAFLVDAARVLAIRTHVEAYQLHLLRSRRVLVALRALLDQGLELARTAADRQTTYRNRVTLTANHYRRAASRWWGAFQPQPPTPKPGPVPPEDGGA